MLRFEIPANRAGKPFQNFTLDQCCSCFFSKRVVF